ncbi:hypothetical protein ISS85_03045 [Candidatus Microgenomates bacterium]|nr:hypothetical protein [Candidatus Microgenomates bacterium]
MKKTILALSLIFFSFICFSFFKEKSDLVRFGLAQEEEKTEDSLRKQIEEYEQKLIETQSKAKTLSSQITYMNTQITLTGLQIQDTLEKIEKLAIEIVSLSEKIERLEGSLTSVSEILLNRIISTYKTGKVPPVYLLFSSEGFSDLLLRAKYLKIAQLHDKKLMMQMQSTKENFGAQKDLREEKKEEQESLKAKLEIQKQALAQQKKDKEHLLTVTKNDEKRYQELLAATRAELEAIQSIIAGKGEETEVKKVGQGEKIATIIAGKSACSTGTHLHFEIRDNGEVKNPFSYLKSIDLIDDSGGDPHNASGDWEWPLNQPIEFNQGFGSGTWSINHGIVWYDFHTGIDIASADRGVKSTKEGTLYRGGISCGGGTLRYVKVDHDDSDIDTYYLHVNY